MEQCIPKKERLMLAPSHDLSICSVTRDHFLVSSFLLEPGPCQNLYPLVFVPSFVCSTIPVHKVLVLLHTYVVVLVLLVNDRIIFLATFKVKIVARRSFFV